MVSMLDKRKCSAHLVCILYIGQGQMFRLIGFHVRQVEKVSSDVTYVGQGKFFCFHAGWADMFRSHGTFVGQGQIFG